MNKFVYRALCDSYEQSTRDFLQELRKHKQQVGFVSPAIVANYHDCLNMLRLFLDNEGFPMPRPKWRYDDHDQSTWLYTPQKSLNKNFHMLQARRR